jgi:hypothetical protein
MKTIPNIFTLEVTNSIIDRINSLTNETPALWGKMDVAKMLGHCNVTYEMIFSDNHPKPNAFTKLILKLFVKNKSASPAIWRTGWCRARW